MEVKNIECLKFEGEVIALRKELESVKVQLGKNKKFDRSTNLLNEMIVIQKNSKDSIGVGYKVVQKLCRRI